MTTNISEFERTKPRQTFAAIQDLEKYIQFVLDGNEKQHPNCVIELIQQKVKSVKESFLKGE